MIRRVPSKHKNSPVAREVDNRAIIRLTVLLVSGLVIAAGFLYAGRQHFAALRYGYETESLRRVHEELAEQQRRFLLEREAALNPARLERAARQLGLQPLQPTQLDPIRRNASRGTEPPDRPQARESKARSRTAKADKGSKPI
jgi:hypothetical protein